jgi:SlyX protein
MTQDRIDAAEIHISHLTRTIDELSDQVASQGHQIDRLNARLNALLDRLSKQGDDGQSDTPLLEQRPPHW